LRPGAIQLSASRVGPDHDLGVALRVLAGQAC